MKIVCTKDTKRKDLIKFIRHLMIDSNVETIDIARSLGVGYETARNILWVNYRPESKMAISQFAAICNALGYDVTISATRHKDS